MAKKKAGKPANRFRDILASSGQAKQAAATPIAQSGRRLKAGYTQVGANIPLTLKREVFKRLQDEGRNFSNLVEDLLTEWLEASR